MQDKHFGWPPYFFLGSAVPPHFYHSRIATDIMVIMNKLQFHLLKAKLNIQFHF